MLDLYINMLLTPISFIRRFPADSHHEYMEYLSMSTLCIYPGALGFAYHGPLQKNHLLQMQKWGNTSHGILPKLSLLHSVVAFQLGEILF